MAGETARELAREFGLGRALNPAVGKPVFHGSLTAAPEDRLSEEQWRRLAAGYLERLGYGDCAWVLVRHRDTANDHVHIVASRIDSRGRRVQDHQERRRGEAIVRDLEREFGLTKVAPSREASRAAPGRGELAAFARTSQVAVKARLQEHIDLAARGAPSLVELTERLRVQGVSVRAHVAATGRLSGLSFELDGIACKGSDLGRGYSWRGLAARAGVHYEAPRDLPALSALGALPAREVPGVAEAACREAPGSSSRGERAARVPGGVAASAGPAQRQTPRMPPPPLDVAAREVLRQRLRDAVDRAAGGGPTLPEFADRLRAAGVEVRANLATTGKLSGLSFELAGVRLKGSELGRDYAWRALAARCGITFEPARDRSALERGGATAGAEPAAAEQVSKPAAVYRAAAVLGSRAEVQARMSALHQRLEESVGIRQEAVRLLEERARERHLVPLAPEAIERGLWVVYEAPEAAGRKLAKLLAREGALRAAEVLEHSPERLGRLRGRGLGGLRSALRRTALLGAAGLGHELRAAVARQERFAAGEPAAAAAATRQEKAQKKLRRIWWALRRLPSWPQLEADMVRAAGELGARLTRRLAPALAGSLIRGALRATLDLARGRDDDDRSLGR